jgi:hypothetical protein
LYRLSGEEDVLSSGMVEGTVKWAILTRIRAVGRVFEEEDDTIYWLQRGKLGRVEC